MCTEGQYALDLGGGKAWTTLKERFPDREVFCIDFDPTVKQAFPEVIARDIDTEHLPFCDNSCFYIRAIDFLEHCRNLSFVMNECYRVLCHGGLMEIRSPRGYGDSAWGDPDHCRVINKYTIEHFEYPIPKSGIATRFEVAEDNSDNAFIKMILRANKSEPVPWLLAPVWR